MSTRIEYLAREYLKWYFPNEEVIYNWRPDFLKNPETGKNFEIDIYYPFLRFGIEVNSIYHETRQNRERDKFKIKKCRQNNIRLLQVWNNRQIASLRFKLRQFITDERLNLYIPNNDYLAILNYKPKSSKSGYAVSQQVRYEKGVDAQRAEIQSLKR